MADRRTNTKALGIKIAQRQKQKDRVTERDYKEGEKEAVKAAGGYSMGGMCRGMGAAIKGGKFGGVK